MENILDWLDLTYKKSGDGYMATCPFHKNGQERTASMGITQKRSGIIFHCFGCDAAGTIAHLISSLKGISVAEAIQLLEIKFGVNLQSSQLQAMQDVVVSIPKWESRFTDDGGLNENVLELYKGKDPTKYLERRGIEAQTIKHFEIGYDRWKERVTFPVRDYDGTLVGLTGRSVADAQPKYLFYDHFPKSNYLYGANEVKRDRKTQIVVVEGHIDRIWLWQAGIENVVALQGSHASTAQADFLRSNASEVLIWLDNDPAGHDGRNHLVYLLKNSVKVYSIDWENFPKAKDPTDFELSNIEKAVREKFLCLRNFLQKA